MFLIQGFLSLRIYQLEIQMYILNHQSHTSLTYPELHLCNT